MPLLNHYLAIYKSFKLVINNEGMLTKCICILVINNEGIFNIYIYVYIISQRRIFIGKFNVVYLPSLLYSLINLFPISKSGLRLL